MAIFSMASLKSPTAGETNSFTVLEKNNKEMGTDAPAQALQNIPTVNMNISKAEAYFRSR